ncbi:MAG: ATP-grasp domain-containing protein [Gemmatimonadota bacterium]
MQPVERVEHRPGARVLLLMSRTTYRAQAFLEAAERLELDAAVGSDHRLPLADLSPACSLELDFRSLQPSVEAIVRLAEGRPLAAVVSVDDSAAVLAARAARALNLPHNPPEAVRAALYKHEMRELARRAGVPGPAFRLFSTGSDPGPAAAETRYPCVLKPVYLSASRGVIRADDPPSFVAAHRRISRILADASSSEGDPSVERLILIEDYLPGAEVALEGLLVDGRLHTLALFDKPDPLDGPFFEETILLTPSRLGESVRRAVVACAEAAVGALGLREGPVHAEFRIHEGRAWLLEVAPRSIGGLCARVLRFADGSSLEELILRHAVGLPIETLEREAGAAGVMMVPIPKRGTLRAVRGLEAARLVRGIEEALLTIPPDEELIPLPEGHRYLGFLFARGDTPDEVERALRRAHGRLDIVIE